MDIVVDDAEYVRMIQETVNRIFLSGKTRATILVRAKSDQMERVATLLKEKFTVRYVENKERNGHDLTLEWY